MRLIADPSKLKLNVDRMAFQHLRDIGAIHEAKAGRPAKHKISKAPRPGRIGWKKLGPMRGGGDDRCGQCGDAVASNHHYGGGHEYLCSRCFAVLEHSRKFWAPNEDFPSAG